MAHGLRYSPLYSFLLAVTGALHLDVALLGERKSTADEDLRFRRFDGFALGLGRRWAK
jgi:hypothetical protein